MRSLSAITRELQDIERSIGALMLHGNTRPPGRSAIQYQTRQERELRLEQKALKAARDEFYAVTKQPQGSELSRYSQRPGSPWARRAKQPQRHERTTVVRCSKCNWSGVGFIGQPITCAACGHTAEVKPPQRPQDHEARSACYACGLLPSLCACKRRDKQWRECREGHCDWQGPRLKTKTLTGPGPSIKDCCPKCYTGTKRARKPAGLTTLGSLDLTPPPQPACGCRGRVSSAVCEWHRDHYCEEHGWCELCAQEAASPQSEALKAVLSVPLPEVIDPTDDLIAELDATLNDPTRVWVGQTAEQRNALRFLFAPAELRWLNTEPLPIRPSKTGGVLSATLVREWVNYPPNLLDGIDLPETAEANYRRLTAEARKRRQEAEATGAAGRYHRDPDAEAECLTLGHVQAEGHDRCIRCKLTIREQELLRAKVQPPVDFMSECW